MKATVFITAISLVLATRMVLAMPVAEPPLPELATILARALERAKLEAAVEREFKARYTYTRTRLREYYNSNGEVRKREHKQSVHDPLAAARKATANGKGNGEPNAPAVDADVDEPINDSTTQIKGKAFQKQDFPLNEDLLERFKFTLRGRELVQGRPALVLDFKPASKNLPERNLKDKFINQAAGRVWLDEADAAVAKADLHLTRKVNVVGGLVGAVSKFTCTVERERTEDGYWYVRATHWQLEGREVMFQRIVKYWEERTDVRPVL